MTFEVIIVGAGISGVALAMQLKRKGLRKILVIERNSSCGGVWYDHSHPMWFSDTVSYFYDIREGANSGLRNPWFGKGSRGVCNDLAGVLSEYGVEVVYETRVQRITWVGDRWSVETETNGRSGRLEGTWVAACTGVHSRMHVPNIVELGDIPRVHSSRYLLEREGQDLSTVLVVGCGESAFRCAEYTASLPVCRRVFVYSRSNFNRNYINATSGLRNILPTHLLRCTQPFATEAFNSFVHAWAAFNKNTLVSDLLRPDCFPRASHPVELYQPVILTSCLSGMQGAPTSGVRLSKITFLNDLRQIPLGDITYAVLATGYRSSTYDIAVNEKVFNLRKEDMANMYMGALHREIPNHLLCYNHDYSSTHTALRRSEALACLVADSFFGGATATVARYAENNPFYSVPVEVSRLCQHQDYYHYRPHKVSSS